MQVAAGTLEAADTDADADADVAAGDVAAATDAAN